jgi:hypothetical protein
MLAERPSNEALLASQARVPEHVVHRAFVKETVVLNLQTGKYHGLNPTGGRMLELVTSSPTLRDAAAKLAEEYRRPVSEIEADLCDFCAELVERGLIELGAPED